MFRFYFFLSLHFIFLYPQNSYSEVNVGAILPYSGSFAKYGALVRQGLEKGRSSKIHMLYEDERCEPMAAVRAYRKLSSANRIRIFLGPICGSPQTAIAPLLVKDKSIAILGNAAPESVYTLSKGHMLSSQNSLENESRFLGKQMNKRGIKSLIMVFRESDFSRTHEAALKSVFKGEVLDVIAFNSEDVTEMKSAAIQIRKKKPQAIFAPDATPFFLGLTKELANLGLKDTPIWSVYGIQTNDVLNAIGKEHGPIIYSYPDIGEKDALEYYPFQAMKMLSSAVETCSDDVTCILEYLKKHYSFNDHGFIENRLILKTIKDGKFVNFS